MTVEENAMQLTNTKALKFRLMQKNTGKVNGDEIVQLYLRDEYANVSRPLKELKGF
jgi:beta-glucosidase